MRQCGLPDKTKNDVDKLIAVTRFQLDLWSGIYYTYVQLFVANRRDDTQLAKRMLICA